MTSWPSRSRQLVLAGMVGSARGGVSVPRDRQGSSPGVSISTGSSACSGSGSVLLRREVPGRDLRGVAQLPGPRRADQCCDGSPSGRDDPRRGWRPLPGSWARGADYGRALAGGTESGSPSPGWQPVRLIDPLRWNGLARRRAHHRHQPVGRLPPRPPPQAPPRLAGHPAPRRADDLDHPHRTQLHQPTPGLPDRPPTHRKPTDGGATSDGGTRQRRAPVLNP
jgi:hypothetical protein